eukprot:169748-Prymnesium_polylepis.1
MARSEMHSTGRWSTQREHSVTVRHAAVAGTPAPQPPYHNTNHTPVCAGRGPKTHSRSTLPGHLDALAA